MSTEKSSSCHRITFGTALGCRQLNLSIPAPLTGRHASYAGLSPSSLRVCESSGQTKQNIEVSMRGGKRQQKCYLYCKAEVTLQKHENLYNSDT